MKSKILASFPSFSAKVCAFGLIHVLTFGTGVNLLSNPSVVTAAIAGDEATPVVDVQDEILWFARAIYSETKVPAEQTLVAWVIRNRVESGKFRDTYKGVVLQPGQFSGFSSVDAQYGINSSLTLEDENPSWKSAVAIAEAVYVANPILRPLSADVLHFYSPISVVNTPKWAQGRDADHVVRDMRGNARFAFYADIL
ncbi:MAG: cell wall hydrolase [Candidatus Campbellbacteria bacterium]|nr:cell wall hydrolase [Candidatus Campbellbacteria bacterium]